jgi:hypothetical protein
MQTMKSNSLRNMVAFCLVEIHQRFGETYCFHLQARRVSKESGKHVLLNKYDPF